MTKEVDLRKEVRFAQLRSIVGLQQADVIEFFGESHANPYIKEAARQLDNNDDASIDDFALVSEADDGYWVQTWTWISNSDAGFINENRYRHIECNTEWTDIDSGAYSSSCPECCKKIEPYESNLIATPT